MDKQDALKRINTFQDNTMTEQIGIEITDFGDDFICGRMPVDHRTVQPFGLLHGGASATLAETLGSIAGGLKVDRELQTVVGVEINCNHLRSAKDGWVYGKATPVKNDDEKLVCVSRLTLAVVNKS